MINLSHTYAKQSPSLMGIVNTSFKILGLVCLLTLASGFTHATTPTGGGTKTGGTTPATKTAAATVAPAAAMRAVRQFAELEDFDALFAEAATAAIEAEAMSPSGVSAYALAPEGFVFAGPQDAIDSAQYYVAKAQEVISEIREARKFVGYLDGNDLLSLPVGIHKEINGQSYDIGIASVTLKPRYAELEVYMQFTVPQNGKVLTFRGKGIKFTQAGGIAGDARLELVADYAINLDGDKSQLILKAGTFATFECSGFEEMYLDAAVKFSRDMLLPEDENGQVIPGNVMSSFSTSIRSWDDLIVQLDLPNFQIKGVDGMGFSVRDAVFDFSDSRNIAAVQFPENYEHPDLQGGVPELWQGFYLRELSVRLPNEFTNSRGGVATTFTANDMLIDHMGFSGKLRAEGLIPLNEGSMNGWAFSLDSLGVELVANQIVSGGFDGDIILPVAEESQRFAYDALVNPGSEYIFNITFSEDLQFKMFQTSKVELYEGSSITVAVVDGEFRPKATLHGNMDISTKLGSNEQGVSLAAIDFESLQIQSVAPYIQVGSFSFGSEALEQKMANLPISINNIGMRTIDDRKVGLDFDLIVNLSGSGGGSISGESGMTLVGEMQNGGSGLQDWRYSYVQVHKVSIDVDGGAFKFKGQLQFYEDDPVYGEGFNGQVDAEFQPGIGVQATAIFGTVDDYRYWYADALASLPSGIPVFTGVGIYGFGGGAYYHMQMDTDGVGSELGQTASGVVYVPNGDAGLGLKATVEIGSHPKPEAFNGDVTLEVAFYNGGGIRYISFQGNGYLATPPMTSGLTALQDKVGKMADKVSELQAQAGPAGALLAANPADNSTATQIYGEIGDAAGEKGSISAHVHISYDFENRVLHGNFETYVKVAGGLIQGVGDNGRAGWAVLHFAPGEWYVWVGTPDDRIGLKMGVGPISAQATSYFMVGTKIMGSPPPPPEVAEILGMDEADLDYMRDLNALGDGAGFAFGASFSMDTGDLSFLMFYARFRAGAGFDIMLKDYGSATCAGSSGPIGINGWYANGQAYAYFDGKIGIRVKLFGRRKSVNILSIGAAALLQAKLPNPFWMRGIVGGRFSVLGGLVKGNCRFEVTIGEECDLEGGSVVEGIKVIAEVTPNDGEVDVSVFNVPQAVFNMPVDKVFSMVDLDEKRKDFRIRLDAFEVRDQSGRVLTGTDEWNATKDVIAFNSFDVFPPESSLELRVQVSFEERVGGSWQAVVVDGNNYVEAQRVKFVTGEAPNYIPEHNIAYSYPVVNQLNFYPAETNQGYIKLKQGQPYLFDVNPNEWLQRARFVSATSTSALTQVGYNSGQREVYFGIPGQLSTSSIYTLELVNVPANSGQAIDRNVTESVQQVSLNGSDGETALRKRQAEGNIEDLQEQLLYSAHLRTSQFSTFRQKMAAADWSITSRRPIRNGVHQLLTLYRETEYFDQSELIGVGGQGPMIQFEAILTNNRYFNEFINPIIYDGYPLMGGSLRITNRNVSVMGVPPVKAVYINQNPEPYLMLSETDITAGIWSGATTSAGFIYNLPHYYERDYINLQNQIANNYATDGTALPERLLKLMVTPFPSVIQGNYPMKVKYVLPGKNTVTSEFIIPAVNPVE